MKTTPNKQSANSDQQDLSHTIKDIIELIQSGENALANGALDTELSQHAHNPDLNHLKGLVAYQQGYFDDADNWIRKAIFIKPDNANYHNNLGNVYKAKGLLAEAEQSYRRSLEIDPNLVDGISNLGTIYLAAGNPEQAIGFFQRALDITPRYPQAQINMSSALLSMDRYQEVVDICSDLVDRSIEFPVVYSNWGRALKGNGDFFDAVDIFDAGVGKFPEDADLHNFRGICLRLIGDLEDGWKGYQWEPYSTDASRVIFDLSVERWHGEPIESRSLLIYGEQGIGDEIMFASCFEELIVQTEKTIIACEPRLKGLFERSFPGATIVAGYSFELLQDLIKSHDIDICCPMGDIPVYVRSKISSFKKPAPYLVPESALVSKWHKRYEEVGAGLKVGISWAGGKDSIQNRHRSIPLMHWIKLLDNANVQFINIQYGDVSGDLRALEMETGVTVYDWSDTNGLTEMDDFSAKISALDLVISIDNSTVHLAGALGVETYVMLPMVPDWRWLLERADSLWYSSIKLFRQLNVGIWTQVLDEVGEALNNKVKMDCLPQPKPTALFVNDTSNWYHWGCTATSSMIRRNLKEIGYSLNAITIDKIVSIQVGIEQIDDLDSDTFFEKYANENRSVISAISSNDLIILNGEGSLHGTNQTSINLLYIAYIAKQRFGKNVQIINHSCYPKEVTAWLETVEFDLYKYVYDKLDYIGVREPVGQRLLESGGISCTSTFDCMPLFIDQYRGDIKRNERSGVVLAGSVSWLESSLKAISDLVIYLQEKNLEVTVLIGARDNIAGDDVNFVNQLYAALDGKLTVKVASTLQEWLQTLADTSLLISGRFHHTIAAAMLDTPFVLLNSNTPKLEGILELIGGDAPLQYDDPQLHQRLCNAADDKLRDAKPPVTDAQKQKLVDLGKLNFTQAERFFIELTSTELKNTELTTVQETEPMALAEPTESVSVPKPQRMLENTQHGLFLFDQAESVEAQSLLNYGEYAIDTTALFSQLLNEGSQAVVFGCGLGVMSVEIAKHVGDSGHVWIESHGDQQLLLLCANIALNELTNTSFFDSALDSPFESSAMADLPAHCDLILLDNVAWSSNIEQLVKGRFADSKPFIMVIESEANRADQPAMPGYTFVEYSIDVARSDNFKGALIDSHLPQIHCLVGVPSP